MLLILMIYGRLAQNIDLSGSLLCSRDRHAFGAKEDRACNAAMPARVMTRPAAVTVPLPTRQTCRIAKVAAEARCRHAQSSTLAAPRQFPAGLHRKVRRIAQQRTTCHCEARSAEAIPGLTSRDTLVRQGIASSLRASQ
jgi:hypothetical protein